MNKEAPSLYTKVWVRELAPPPKVPPSVGSIKIEAILAPMLIIARDELDVSVPD